MKKSEPKTALKIALMKPTGKARDESISGRAGN